MNHSKDVLKLLSKHKGMLPRQIRAQLSLTSNQVQYALTLLKYNGKARKSDSGWIAGNWFEESK